MTLLKWLLHLLRKQRPKPATHLLWTVGPISEQPGVTRAWRFITMLQLTNTQQCPIAVQGVDKKGNPAELDSVVFTSSDPSVATVDQDPADQTKALVKAVAAGTAQINVTADADLGDGVTEITGALDLAVVAGQAVGFVINTGTPEEQP
jgi:hypothetical protein